MYSSVYNLRLYIFLVFSHAKFCVRRGNVPSRYVLGSRVALGMSRRGADSSKVGAKLLLFGKFNTKISEKIVFHPPTGG